MSNKIAKGAMYLAIAQLLFMAAGYITNVWLGRHLGPEMYGIYGVLTSLVTALNIMQVSGVPQALSKYVAEDHFQRESVLKTSLKVQIVTTFIFSLLFIVFAPTVAHLFHNNEFIQYMFIAALIFPFYGLFALYGGYYNGLHDFKRQATINSIYSLVKLFAVIGLALVFSLKGAIVGFVIAPIVALLFAFHWPRSSSSFPVKKLLIFSLPLIAYSVLNTLQFSIDLFSLRAIETNNTNVGYYVAAQNIALIIFMSMSALGQVLYPNVARLLKEKKLDELEVLISKSIYFSLMILLPLAALFIGTAPSLVKLLYGKSYGGAITSLRIIVLGYIALSIFTLLANVLNGAGRAKQSAWFAALGVLTTLILTIILVPKVGIKGAAIGSAVGAIFSAVVSIIALRRLVKVKVPYVKLVVVLALSALLVLISWSLKIPSAYIAFYWLLALLIYIALLLLTKVLIRSELAEAIRIVRKDRVKQPRL